MKRYWLFIYVRGAAKGGFRDYVGSYDTMEETQKAEREKGSRGTQYQIIDSLSFVAYPDQIEADIFNMQVEAECIVDQEPI